MILETIQNDLKEALKAREPDKVSALRFLLAQIHNREIDLVAQGAAMTDKEVIGVLQKQAKERRESIEAFKQGKREDLVRKEEAELEILNKYLPQQLTPEELRKIIDEVVSEIGETGPVDFGQVMKVAMTRVAGRADGQTVANLVKEIVNR